MEFALRHGSGSEDASKVHSNWKCVCGKLQIYISENLKCFSIWIAPSCRSSNNTHKHKSSTTFSTKRATEIVSMQTYKRAHYWLGFCICIMEPVVHYKHCLFHRGLFNQWLKLCRLQREIKILPCKCVSILLCYDMKAGCGSSKTLFSQAGNLQAFEISTTHLKKWHFCWQIPGIFLVLFIFIFIFFFNQVTYSLEKKEMENLPASMYSMLQTHNVYDMSCK